MDDHHRRLLPQNFKEHIFLRRNSHLWEIENVNDAFKERRLSFTVTNMSFSYRKNRWLPQAILYIQCLLKHNLFKSKTIQLLGDIED